jgi:hypothetical protein
MVLMGCHACRRRGYCLGRWEQAHFFGFLVVKQQRHEPQYNFHLPSPFLPSAAQHHAGPSRADACQTLEARTKADAGHSIGK